MSIYTVVVIEVLYTFPRMLTIKYAVIGEHLTSGIYMPLPSGSVNIAEVTRRIQDDLAKRLNDPGTAVFKKAAQDLMGMELNIPIPDQEKNDEEP